MGKEWIYISYKREGFYDINIKIRLNYMLEIIIRGYDSNSMLEIWGFILEEENKFRIDKVIVRYNFKSFWFKKVERLYDIDRLLFRDIIRFILENKISSNDYFYSRLDKDKQKEFYIYLKEVLEYYVEDLDMLYLELKEILLKEFILIYGIDKLESEDITERVYSKLFEDYIFDNMLERYLLK